jgi:peptidylprolyl isomerase
MRVGVVTIAVCGVLAIAGCGGSSSGSIASTAEGPPITKVQGPEPKVSVPKEPPPKQLIVKDLKKGSGAEAKAGDEITIQFVGIRYVNDEKFESSWEPGSGPFTFHLDHEDVSPGWVQGIPGMKVGGRRELIVPTPLTSRYGIPPGTGSEGTLFYVIDLLDVR